MRVTLVDGLFFDYSTAIPLYLKLYRDLPLCSSRVFVTVYVSCCVLCHILPNLTIDVILGMDWLCDINPQIDWNAYSLYLDYGGHIVRILGT